MGTTTRGAEQKRGEWIRPAPPRPMIIDACRLVEDNAQNLSDEELAQWDAAVDEYRQAKARRRWHR